MTTHWSCRETNVVRRMIFFMSYFDGYLRQSFPNILGFCRLPAALLQKTSNFAVVEEIRSRNLKPSKLGGVVVTSLPTKIQSSIKYQYFLIKTKCKTHFVFYVVQMIWCSSIFWRNLSSPIFYSRHSAGDCHFWQLGQMENPEICQRIWKHSSVSGFHFLGREKISVEIKSKRNEIGKRAYFFDVLKREQRFLIKLLWHRLLPPGSWHFHLEIK